MISEAKRAVILVVEDELLIRMNAVEMIEEAFEVVEAGNAEEAIVILEGRLDVAVVFTDIQMPGSLDGLKLAAVVRLRWPPIKIVATSGQVKIGVGTCRRAVGFCKSPTVPLKS